MYRYRAGYRGPREITAEAVAAELERIRAEADLTAEAVVEAARPKTATLHAAFPWDDKKAAHEHRLQLARVLIRAVVVVSGTDAEPETVYVHVPDDSERQGKYVQLADVLSNTSEYERALREAGRDLDAAERRFYELRRLSEGRGDSAEALAIALQGFSTVRDALRLLHSAAA